MKRHGGPGQARCRRSRLCERSDGPIHDARGVCAGAHGGDPGLVGAIRSHDLTGRCGPRYADLMIARQNRYASYFYATRNTGRRRGRMRG